MWKILKLYIVRTQHTSVAKSRFYHRFQHMIYTYTAVTYDYGGRTGGLRMLLNFTETPSTLYNIYYIRFSKYLFVYNAEEIKNNNQITEWRL